MYFKKKYKGTEKMERNKGAEKYLFLNGQN